MQPHDFRSKVSHIPVAREGIPYILAAAFATLTAALLAEEVTAWILLALTLLVGHFFRDPERISPGGEDTVLSPADGTVIRIEKVHEVPFVDRPLTKISIFMSVFNVHVNRVPVSGTVCGRVYRKGRFLAAQKDRAGRENEQNWLWIRTEEGRDIILTQVAGLIARRIVCWPSVGDRVIRGERFGLIRFGSRVDIYVPLESEVLVSRGEHVCGGETVLCHLK